MLFENVEVHGFEAALRGMRNAHKSHHLASPEKDMNLAKTLIDLGPSHAKFLRQIIVWVDITAPRYWWSEFDTYKVGTVANSESTMHTLLRDGVSLKDFEIDPYCDSDGMYETFNYLNWLAKQYQEETDQDKKNELLREAKMRLPEGFLQKRTVMMSYAALRNMYQQRHDHRLNEWHEFCFWAKLLPESWMISTGVK